MNYYDLEMNRQDQFEHAQPQTNKSGMSQPQYIYHEHAPTLPEQPIPVQYPNLTQPFPQPFPQYLKQTQSQPQVFQIPPTFQQYHSYPSYTQEKYEKIERFVDFDSNYSSKKEPGKEEKLFDPDYQMSSSYSSRDEIKSVKSHHNIIEQRYRNKINTKFETLQQLVPSLRYALNKNKRSMGFDEDLEGLEPARKLNKGTILAKSIEYIQFLEMKNEKLKLENQRLVDKLNQSGSKV